MKPWLFDILACPIDKSFPLELYVFSLETRSEDIQSFVKIYKTRNIDVINDEDIINIYNEEGGQYYKDNIVIQKQKLEEYIELIISSIDELEYINDNSPSKLITRYLDILKTEIKEKIIKFSKNPEDKQFNQILPELYLLNKFKLEIEIKSGILFCKKCERWYPIIETIPQMLPDNYRDKKKEIEFLKNNKNLLNKEFFYQDLKPFNI
ncbi:hypothetical protein LCGC14_1318360 [marine sediment metagenome]|uniref:Trm112p-like protein n=1 Tax=marine sediment metagenome TaxID=412755 RepID=A0A0F9L5L9_9ZZZZ